jgi:hypothetical protein
VRVGESVAVRTVVIEACASRGPTDALRFPTGRTRGSSARKGGSVEATKFVL